MRFLSLFKTAHLSDSDPALNPAMGKLIEEETKAGTLLATGGFLPSPKDVRVRNSKGKITVTDGPFTEAKELIGGFALLEAKSREEAIEMGKRFLKIAGDGELEIHQLMDGP
jgi:hypothetical protein